MYTHLLHCKKSLPPVYTPSWLATSGLGILHTTTLIYPRLHVSIHPGFSIDYHSFSKVTLIREYHPHFISTNMTALTFFKFVKISATQTISEKPKIALKTHMHSNVLRSDSYKQ